MIRRLAIPAAAALVAGVAALLAIDAASRAWGNPGAAVLVALAAAWLGQAIPPLIRRPR